MKNKLISTKKIKYFLKKIDDFVASSVLKPHDSLPSYLYNYAKITMPTRSHTQKKSIIYNFDENTERLIESIGFLIDKIGTKIPVYIISIPNALLLPRGVVLYQSKIIKESIVNNYSYFIKLRSKWRYYLKFMYPNNYVKVELVSLENYLDTNYFHWVADTIPRISMLLDGKKTSSPLKVYVKVSKNTFHKDTLMSIFGNSIDIIENKTSKLFVDQLLIPSWPYIIYEGKFRLYNPYYWDTMRKNFDTQNPAISELHIHNVILVSRKKAKSRKITNEDKLLNDLIRNDNIVEIISFEDIDFKNQIALVQNNGIMIAPHGASSANLLFGRVRLFIELMPLRREKGMKPIYVTSQICNHMNINHHVIGVENDTNENIIISDEVSNLILEIINEYKEMVVA